MGLRAWLWAVIFVTLIEMGGPNHSGWLHCLTRILDLYQWTDSTEKQPLFLTLCFPIRKAIWPFVSISWYLPPRWTLSFPLQNWMSPFSFELLWSEYFIMAIKMNQDQNVVLRCEPAAGIKLEHVHLRHWNCSLAEKNLQLRIRKILESWKPGLTGH